MEIMNYIKRYGDRNDIANIKKKITKTKITAEADTCGSTVLKIYENILDSKLKLTTE